MFAELGSLDLIGERLFMKFSRRNKNSNKHRGPWVTYMRCFNLTLGMLFLGVVLFVHATQGEQKAEWPEWASSLLVVLGLYGAFFLGVGLLGSRKDNESVAEKSGHHEAIFIVMILAAPLYLLLKLFEKMENKSRD